jgi:hypothetical protein
VTPSSSPTEPACDVCRRPEDGPYERCPHRDRQVQPVQVRHRAGPEGEVVEVMRTLRRLVVVVAGVTGLLVVFGGAAHALLAANHCEPVRRA